RAWHVTLLTEPIPIRERFPCYRQDISVDMSTIELVPKHSPKVYEPYAQRSVPSCVTCFPIPFYWGFTTDRATCYGVNKYIKACDFHQEKPVRTGDQMLCGFARPDRAFVGVDNCSTKIRHSM